MAAIEGLEEALRKRAADGVHRLAQIGREAMMEALAAPNEVEFFAFITSELATHVRPDQEAVAKERVAAARFRERLTKLSGGFLTASEAAKVAGTSSQAIYKSADARRLIVVDERGRKRFPAFQFDETIRESLVKLLRETPSTSGWELLQFLFGKPEGMAGEQPINLLRRGKRGDVEKVVRFGRALED